MYDNLIKNKFQKNITHHYKTNTFIASHRIKIVLYLMLCKYMFKNYMAESYYSLKITINQFIILKLNFVFFCFAINI